MEFEPRLQAVLRAVLELPPDAAVVDAAPETTPTWDSLAHAVLIGAIEGEFGIQVDAGDSLELTSYSAIVRYLSGRGL